MLGLLLTAGGTTTVARGLTFAAIGAADVSGLLLTVLVLTAGDGVPVVAAAGPSPLEAVAEEELLRPRALAFVVLAPLWFAALAASRLSATR